MARVLAFHTDFIQPKRVELSWYGVDDLVSYVYLNGGLAEGGRLDEGSDLDRSLEVDVGDMFSFQIYEVDEDSDEVVSVEDLSHIIRPEIFWSEVASAKYYAVFLRRSGPTGDEIRVAQVWPTDVGVISRRLREDLSGPGARWVTFRIEAVSDEEVESTGNPIYYFVKAVADEPSDAAASGTSPNITITLTA